MIALLKTAERADNITPINNYVYQRHLFAYLSIQNQVAGKHVLELGCGEGYGMEIISGHARSYLAVDKKKPKSVSFNENKVFQQCCLPSLSGIANNRFDIVICFQVIEHIRKDNRLLGEIKRVLKPGGILFLTTPNLLMSLTRNPFHVREYTPQQIIDLTAGHFDNFNVRGIYGNDAVLKYYYENKRSVENITRLDIFNLQYRLPALVLKGIYSLLNNYNRFMLARKVPGITAGIRYDDFYLDICAESCLDYFVTAVKEV